MINLSCKSTIHSPENTAGRLRRTDRQVRQPSLQDKRFLAHRCTIGHYSIDNRPRHLAGIEYCYRSACRWFCSSRFDCLPHCLGYCHKWHRQRCHPTRHSRLKAPHSAMTGAGPNRNFAASFEIHWFYFTTGQFTFPQRWSRCVYRLAG